VRSNTFDREDLRVAGLANSIAENLASVHRRIAGAAAASGRRIDEVRLVAVSKGHDQTTIAAALAAGQRIFGENRVQEAAVKWPPLRTSHADVRLHLIGPLQTNKVRAALDLFDVIETVDRPRLADALARARKPSDRLSECFIQVNTGEEPQKSGIAPAEADRFVALCRQLGLPVGGLMCIPPLDEEPSLHFALLAKIAARNGLAKLSMGMSGDFEIAIAFGATEIRVGTSIFGQRSPG
jgi:pyridoxal phosphate enzyme (YggS family)